MRLHLFAKSRRYHTFAIALKEITLKRNRTREEILTFTFCILLVHSQVWNSRAPASVTTSFPECSRVLGFHCHHSEQSYQNPHRTFRLEVVSRDRESCSQWKDYKPKSWVKEVGRNSVYSLHKPKTVWITMVQSSFYRDPEKKRETRPAGRKSLVGKWNKNKTGRKRPFFWSQNFWGVLYAHHSLRWDSAFLSSSIHTQLRIFRISPHVTSDRLLKYHMPFSPCWKENSI